MKITRRRLLEVGALGLAAPAAASFQSSELTAPTSAQQPAPALPESFGKLQPLGDKAKPITVEEFQARIAQAQRLMQEPKPRFAAVYLASGSSMYYYTGIRWGGGERLFSLVIPTKGEPLLVCPAFEEGRARELLRWPIEVRVWQEDESPYTVVAGWLRERGLRTGRLGVEETMRFHFFDGLR
ncbi:MAG: aminopeptidase P family N-terminal domain-containing protein [Acidobacteria bacterium]|nr:aminopeptidase P family N-terminal domain-containing protein [Acidobacteriota bacterium]